MHMFFLWFRWQSYTPIVCSTVVIKVTSTCLFNPNVIGPAASTTFEYITLKILDFWHFLQMAHIRLLSFDYYYFACTSSTRNHASILLRASHSQGRCNVIRNSERRIFTWVTKQIVPRAKNESNEIKTENGRRLQNMKTRIQKFQSIPIDIPFRCKCVVNIRVLRSTNMTKKREEDLN